MNDDFLARNPWGIRDERRYGHATDEYFSVSRKALSAMGHIPHQNDSRLKFLQRQDGKRCDQPPPAKLL